MSNPPTERTFVPSPFLVSPPPEDPKKAFQALPASGELFLGQAWQPEPSPEFLPARVRTGWDASHLFIVAELQDADIFNPACQEGDPTWMLGDVFEFFLKHPSRANYYEGHITPANHRLLLHFPAPTHELKQTLRPNRLNPFDYVLPSGRFDSSVNVDSATSLWWVRAALPWTLLGEGGQQAEPHPEWKYSFSRYDYTRGHEHPVCSSTSPHTRLDFHEQATWRTLRLLR